MQIYLASLTRALGNGLLCGPYDVAKMLGDTIETIAKQYTPFVKELRERVRALVETGVGREELALKAAEHPQIAPKKPN